MVIFYGAAGTETYLSRRSIIRVDVDNSSLPQNKFISLSDAMPRLPRALKTKACFKTMHFFELRPKSVKKVWLLFSGLCSLFVLLVIAKTWYGFEDPLEEDSRSEEDCLRTSKLVFDRALRPPPPIARLLPERHSDGRERFVPDDFQRLFVYSAVAVPAGAAKTNGAKALLFLYSQGTVIWSGLSNSVFRFNVTSCLVGKHRIPITHEANGVYACAIDENLKEGEGLSLIISPEVWLQEPSIDERRVFMERLAGLDELEDGSFIVESDVKWEEYMKETLHNEGEGRYGICMMTQEKNFPEYIPEWIAYHRRIGVDYVFIYDNQAVGKLTEIYRDAADVEIVNWPWQRSQLQAQNHFLLTGRRRCEWVLLIDVDEYLVIRPLRPGCKEQPLKRYLRLKRERWDISQIRVTSIALGSSGHIYRPRGPMAESYWHKANLQDNLTKPIVWIGHTLPNSFVHRVEVAPGYYSETSISALDELGSIEIALCHMKYRSWEDYVLKGRGGRNSFHVDEWSYSSNWSVHSPNANHLTIRNADIFVEFRRLWRRLIMRDIQAPELRPPNEANLRYERVKRVGYAWKRRRSLGNTTLHKAIIEEEKCLRKLKQWEINKEIGFQK